MNYKHIVFDIDGTLIHTDYASLQSLQKTIEELQGIAPAISSLEFALGIPSDVALKKLGFSEDSLEAATKLWDMYYQHYKSSIYLYDGIEELLEQLSSHGYTLGIVTSRRAKECAQDLLFNKISSYFKIQIYQDDYSKPKPTPIPLLAYLKKAQIEKTEAVYIGDSIYDAYCAKSANMDFILAAWKSTQQVNWINAETKNAICICEKASHVAPLLINGKQLPSIQNIAGLKLL